MKRNKLILETMIFKSYEDKESKMILTFSHFTGSGKRTAVIICMCILSSLQHPILKLHKTK
jgi:hypothetical protein